MNEQEIQALIQKQQNGTISPEEHRILTEVMESRGYRVEGLDYADITGNMQDPLNLLPQSNNTLMDRGTYNQGTGREYLDASVGYLPRMQYSTPEDDPNLSIAGVDSSSNSIPSAEIQALINRVVNAESVEGDVEKLEAMRKDGTLTRYPEAEKVYQQYMARKIAENPSRGLAMFWINEAGLGYTDEEQNQYRGLSPAFYPGSPTGSRRNLGIGPAGNFTMPFTEFQVHSAKEFLTYDPFSKEEESYPTREELLSYGVDTSSSPTTTQPEQFRNKVTPASSLTPIGITNPTGREQLSPIDTSGIEQNSQVINSFDNIEFGAIPQAPRVLTKEEEDEAKRKVMDNRSDNYNRYGLDRSAYLLGRSLKGGESATTGVAAGLNIGLNLARNIGSGMGHANLETEAEKERRKQQQLFGPRVYREGGSIPMPFEQELTGAYVQGGNPNDQNPEIANVEGGEFLMQEDGQIQKAVGPSHEDGGIPLTRDEVPQAADVLSDDLEIGKENANELKEIYPKIRFHFKDTYAKAYDKIEDNLGVKELIDTQEKINEEIIYQEENVDSDTADLNIEELFLQLEENQAKLNQLEALRQAAFENIYSMQEESKGESPEMEEELDKLEATLQQGEGMMDEQMMMDPNMMGMQAPPMDMGDGMQLGMLPPPQDEMEMEMAPLMRKGGKVLSKANNKGFYSYRDVNGNIRYRSAADNEGLHKKAQQSDSYRIVPESRAPKIMAEGGNTESHTASPYALKSKKVKVKGSDVEVQYVDDVGQYYRDNFIPVRGIDQHNGLDLQHMHDKNMPIPSISAGTVKEVHDNTTSAGYYVVIENDEGQTLRYLHLSDKPNLKVGQRVLPGDIIGNMGNTGRTYSSTGGDGTHLHIDIDRNIQGKKQKDPLEALSKLIGEPIVSDLNKWQQAAIFARDQAPDLGITVNEYYNTLKTRPEVDISSFNNELLSGAPMEEAIVNAPETPEIDYNRTQSATGVGFGSVTKDNVNERLTNLYREFPQVLSNSIFEELFDIEDGNVTLRDGVNLSESINEIKQLQQGIENSYKATAEFIENDDTGLFTEAQKEQAREFIAANRFDGTSKRGIEGKFGDFSSTRQAVRYDRLSPETRKKLNEAGIYNLNQVDKTVLDNLDIDETEKQELIDISSNLPEGVSILLADRPEEQIGENAEPAEAPQAPGDMTATTDDTGVDDTTVRDTGVETTTTEEYGTVFQPYFEPPPAGMQAPQRHTFRMGRMSPEHLNVDQQLAEVAREESFALETLDRLPPAERAGFAADVRLSAQNARNQILTQAEMANMQSRAAAQRANLQLDAQEQQTNIQLDQDYEQKIFQTQNVADESRRNYYRFLNDADWQARQDTFNMRMVNQAQNNYYTDAEGNIRLRSTGEVVQMTPQQKREYQQNVARASKTKK